MWISLFLLATTAAIALSVSAIVMQPSDPIRETARLQS
jgi:hypothetical protein